jgi:KAP-like P-loop domain-containing protein
VITIEGPWGAGKTTILGLLRTTLDELTRTSRELMPSKQKSSTVRRLTGARALWRLWRGSATDLPSESFVIRRTDPKTLTVWFNPWAYQSGDQIWAGLVREIVQAVSDAMLPSVDHRDWYWFARNMRRLDQYRVRKSLLRGLLSPILRLGFLLALIPIIVKLIEPGAKYTVLGHRLGFALIVAALPALAIAAGLAHTVARAAISRASAVLPAEIFVGPVQSSVFADNAQPDDEALHDPLHRSRSGFLYLVQHDVKELLRDIQEAGGDIVVFIDDLDRCNPKVVGEVFEAINLFLAQILPSTRFVIGVDPVILASHLDLVYKDVSDWTSQGSEDPSIGWHAMRKLVQMHVPLPWVSESAMDSLIASILGRPGDESGEGEPITSQQPPASALVPGRAAPSDASGQPTIGTNATATPRSRVGPEVSMLPQPPVTVPPTILEKHPDVVAFIRSRLLVQPDRSARESKRILSVWQFLVRVVERINPLGGTEAVNRAKNLVILAEIVCRWPAVQRVLAHPTHSGNRTLAALAASADDDSAWVAAVSEAGLGSSRYAGNVDGLRGVLRNCNTQEIVQLFDSLF